MPRKPVAIQEWTFKEAEARFSEVFRLARSKGPQRISRGSGAVVVIPAEEFEEVKRARQESLLDVLRRAPVAGLELDFTRDKDHGRDIEL
jgi:antitoxin Phd